MSAIKDFNIYIINYWVLIPAVAIIIILSLLEKRKFRTDLCHGRPALLIPFRFLDGYENRTAYAMAFGTTTSTVVSLITSERTLEFDLPLWATALYVYVQAIVGCLTCFPLFACLTTRYRAVGAILCILYSSLWLSLKLIQCIQDVENVSSSIPQIQLNDTITVNVNIAYKVLQGLPIIFCYLILILYCFYILRRCYLTKTYFNKRMESTIKVHQEEHVRWVLHKFRISALPQDSMNCCSSQTFINKMRDSIKLRYFKNFAFFKYPARIIAFSFVQLNILYWAGLLLMMTTVSILYPFIYAEITQHYVQQYEVELTVIFTVCCSFALIVCILNALAQIFIGIRNYRYDMLRIYQGDRTFVQMSNKTPQNLLTRSMTFPGYQVAFMLWGIMLCFTTVSLLTIVPALSLYLTAKVDALDDLFLNLAQLLSFPVTVLVMFYLQMFMTKRILLQEKVNATDDNPPLNVDNRKFYEIVNYYILFTNMAVGLFTCLFRILQSAFLGIFSIARLDRSVFPLDLESWDRVPSAYPATVVSPYHMFLMMFLFSDLETSLEPASYAAYISMLLVDNAHNNPCMRVFAHLLWTKTLAARLRRVQGQEDTSDVALLFSDQRQRHMTYGTGNHVDNSPASTDQLINPWIFVETNETKGSNQVRTRWYLAYTLINNPQLSKLRKQKLTRDINADRKPSTANVAEERCTEIDVSMFLDIDNSTSCSSTQIGMDDNVLLTDALNHESLTSSA